MLIPSLPVNVLTNVASQALTGSASRASSAAKGFESDLASGNISGAQSFLSTLQTKLSSGNSGAAGSAISAQVTQVSNDLKAGNLNAAQADFSQLKLAMTQQKNGLTAPPSSNGTRLREVLAQTIAGSGDASGPSLAALESYNSLQQSAFAGAVNLSMPANVPSFSANL
jgi:hypothetical protein